MKGDTMSAPDTNVEKQKKQHKPALIGIRGAMLFALVLLLGLIGWVASQGQTPVDPDVKIDGRTGEEVVVE
jgi:cytoskeletal protein RodZ